MKNKKKNVHTHTHTFQCLTESIIVVTHQLLFRFAILLVRVCSQQFSFACVYASASAYVCIIFCSLNALSSSHFSICSRSLSLSLNSFVLSFCLPSFAQCSLSVHLRFYAVDDVNFVSLSLHPSLVLFTFSSFKASFP